MVEFDSFADRYSQIINKRGRHWGSHDYFTWRKISFLKEILSENALQGGSVLDFGAGTGVYTDALQNTLYKVIGVDPSFKMIHSRKVAHFDGKMLPFRNNSFDIVYSICVFHHIIPENRPCVFQGIKRVLKPNGLFIMMEHNLLNPITRYLVLGLDMDKNAIFISPKQGKKMLSHYFDNINCSYILFFPEILKKLTPMEKFLLFFPIGGQYVLTCRK